MDIAFGIFIILLGIAGCILAFKSKSYPINNQSFNNLVTETSPIIPSSNKKEQLRQASSGQTVTLLGEPERAVESAVTLNEMYQPDDSKSTNPWRRSGSESKALVLAGGIWIFKVPSQEAGKPTWLKGQEIESTGLGSFYKGDSSLPGPARIFKNNGQSEPVAYELPRNLTPDITWEIVDIGTFEAAVDGNNDNIYNNDSFPFITSKENGGDNWLIYLDSRKGKARGSGGLFMLELFEPSVDVSDLL